METGYSNTDTDTETHTHTVEQWFSINETGLAYVIMSVWDELDLFCDLYRIVGLTDINMYNESVPLGCLTRAATLIMWAPRGVRWGRMVL